MQQLYSNSIRARFVFLLSRAHGESAYGWRLRTMLEAIDKHPRAGSEKLTVVTKNMARNLSGAGTDELKTEEVYEHIPQVAAFLNDSPKSRNFSKTSWQDIGAHFDTLPASFARVVFDGDLFTHIPATVLGLASPKLGIEFSQDMVEGWQDEFINANTGYNPDLNDTTHAWTREAASSKSITASIRRPISRELLPDSMVEHIEEVALPIYRKLSKYAIGKESPQ